MATFPTLKTAAVAQYPAKKLVRFQNQSVRFLDGSEQRYRDSAGPLHRWTIALDQLDEGEAAAVAGFFEGNQGAFASFSFTDPWDGTVYPNCSLVADQWDLTAAEEMSSATSLTIAENRG